MEYINRTDHPEYKRFCNTLLLEDDQELIKEYRRVHSPGEAWPEITQNMLDVGIIDMEIYIIGNRLFMIMDTLPGFNHDTAMQELSKKPRQSEWEAFVSRFQQTTKEAPATDKWKPMERIYKLER